MIPLVVLVTSIFAVEPATRAQEPAIVVTIRSERAELRTGDEIPVTFDIANAGAGRYGYSDRNYDRSGRMPEYRLHAYDEHGNQLPDPRTLSRMPAGYIGGGLGGINELRPGQHFSKTIALNLWALINEPGVYTVRGFYGLYHGGTVESEPIRIRVLPRSDQEMGAYIDELARELRRVEDANERSRLIKRLMYTCDRRAAWPLLEAAQHDNNAGFWTGGGVFVLPAERRRRARRSV